MNFYLYRGTKGWLEFRAKQYLYERFSKSPAAKKLCKEKLDALYQKYLDVIEDSHDGEESYNVAACNQ